MDEILRSQNSTAVTALSGIATTSASDSIKTSTPRTTQFSLALADPVDTVSLSDEARAEFQNLQDGLRSTQGYKANLVNNKPYAKSIDLDELETFDFDVADSTESYAATAAKDTSPIGNAWTFGSSEDFVAQASLNLDQKGSEFISWNNGTYQLGRNLQSPYGIFNGSGMEMTSAWAGNMVQPQAARAYAAMSMQSQNFAALAPNNTGISLRI